MLKITTLVAAALTTALATAAGAQEHGPASKSLAIGDPAPAIDIEHWLKGEKIDSFEDGKVYIVEFWATWCVPCHVSMPHLGELQKQYKDDGLTIIGVSDEPLETVMKWLDKPVSQSDGRNWMDVIGYTLTTDPDKSVKSDYFTAAGQRGIPSAFIVGKDLKIEWIGNPHPMADDGFDKALEAVIKGEWDRNTYKAELERKIAAEKAANEDRRTLNEATKAGDWSTVVAVADKMLAADPKDRFAAMLKFTTMAGAMNESAKAYAFLKSHLSTHHWDDAIVLNDFSWTILDDDRIKDKDLTYAIGLAMRAVKLTNESDPAILDTYARCWYERGNLHEAIKWQQAAVKLAKDDAMGEGIRATLKKYESESTDDHS